jgi:protein-disulfide isomerase
MPPVPRAPEKKAVGPGTGAASLSPRTRKITLILGGALLVAVILIGISIASGRDTTKSASDGEVIAMLANIPQERNYLGSTSASVTMIEYNDQQCPYCKQYSDDALPTIIEQYVRPGKVRLQVIPFPFIGPDSEKAAKYVVAAESQGKMWQVMELLFANQGTENSGWVTDELLATVGEAVPGLDVEQWQRDADSAAVAEKVRAYTSQARDAGVSSTPSFFIVQPPGAPEAFEPTSLGPEPFVARLNDALGQ